MEGRAPKSESLNNSSLSSKPKLGLKLRILSFTEAKLEGSLPERAGSIEAEGSC